MIRTHDVANAGEGSGSGTPERESGAGGNGNRGDSHDFRPSKRLRTACDRCKSRKQRCDSLLPACSNCIKANAVCTFPFTNNPRYEETLSSHEYIRTLEERIGTLERKLDDPARTIPPPPTPTTFDRNSDHGDTERTHIKQQSRSSAGPGGPSRQASMPVSPLSAGAASASTGAAAAEARPNVAGSNSLANAVGFLSMGGSESEPFYVGSTSGFSIATLVQAMLTVQPAGENAQAGAGTAEAAATANAASSNTQTAAGANGNPALLGVTEDSPSTMGHSPAPKRRTPVPVPPPEETLGDRIVATYFDKLHSRYPILDREEILKAHAERSSIDPEVAPKSEEEEELRFKLYMTWALGARIMQMMGHYDGPYPPESYYLTALKFFPRVPKLASINFITSLVLLTMWTIRMPKGAGLWHVIGLAMRSCLDLGMHREGYYRLIHGEWERQMRRRLWWSCYSIERTVAGILGRPYMIREKEIDAELPADIDDDVRDPEAIRRAIENPRRPDEPSSTLSVGLHLFRFRMIESKITRTFYNSLTRTPTDLLPKIQPYLNMLESWKSKIPPPCLRHMSTESYVPPVSPTSPDQYSLLFYYKAVRLLTQPFLLVVPPTSPEFKACLHASGQICQIFKRLHQRQQTIPYSFISLQYVFISGITMLYCLWLSRDESWTFEVANDLRACSTVLFVICEYLESAKFYRDAFESLVTATTNYLSSETYQPRGQKLRDALKTAADGDNAEGNGDNVVVGSSWEGVRDNGASEDLWSMIADMTGTDVQTIFRDFSSAGGALAPSGSSNVGNTATTTAGSDNIPAEGDVTFGPENPFTNTDSVGGIGFNGTGSNIGGYGGLGTRMGPNGLAVGGDFAGAGAGGQGGMFGGNGGNFMSIPGASGSGMGVPLGFAMGSFDELGGYEWP